LRQLRQTEVDQFRTRLGETGHQDDIDFLVMEYIEGETLAQRLMKGPLPIQQVLQYAIEIADALDKAHRKGITHRDLKPRDTRLERIVAIKVLPTHLADRAELRDRFEREARTIASLNHSHICTLCNVPRIVPSAVTALFIVGSCEAGVTGAASCGGMGEVYKLHGPGASRGQARRNRRPHGHFRVRRGRVRNGDG
jgi:hypothetical protein